MRRIALRRLRIAIADESASSSSVGGASRRTVTRRPGAGAAPFGRAFTEPARMSAIATSFASGDSANVGCAVNTMPASSVPTRC